jgi:putative addiction module component (TIGR02574 family)
MHPITESNPPDPERLTVTDAQRRELVRRSEAHRRNPHEAVPLDQALAEIERFLESDR